MFHRYLTSARQRGQQPDELLQSWKEIAAYLGRDERTARRWEKDEKLPIRRHRKGRRGSVYAYAGEIEAWRAARKPKVDGSQYGLSLVGRGLLVVLVTLSVLSIVWFLRDGSMSSHRNQSATPDGLVLRRIASLLDLPETHRRLSPDGKYISFADWETGNLALREVTSGRTRLVTSTASREGPRRAWASGPVISPNGEWIAYSQFNSYPTGYEIRLVGIDGSGDRTLYKRENDRIQPISWSLDGRFVVAWRSLAEWRARKERREILLIDVQDGSVRTLKTSRTFWSLNEIFGFVPGWGVSLSPDGRFLAFDYPITADSHCRDIALIAADGSIETTMVEHPADDRVLGWFPQGSELLFLSDRRGTYDIFSIRVTNGKVDSPARLIKQNVGRIEPQGFSPDGAFLFSNRTRRSTVKILPLGQEEGRLSFQEGPVLLGNNCHPNWSPDGRNLAYVSVPDWPFEALLYQEALYVWEIESGDKRELLRKRMISLPRWSADGRHILVEADQDLVKVDAESGDTTPLLKRGSRGWDGTEADWFSSGSAIFYNDGRYHLWSRDLESGEKQMLHEQGSPETIMSSNLSPDRQKVAFVSRGEDEGTVRLVTLSLPSGKERELIKHKVSSRSDIPISVPAWSPDGNGLFFASVDEDTSTLWWTSSQEGNPKSIWRSEGHIRGISVDREGRYLALCLRRERKEFWVLENYEPEFQVGMRAKPGWQE